MVVNLVGVKVALTVACLVDGMAALKVAKMVVERVWL